MVVIISSFFTTCTMYMTKIVQALCGQGIAHQGEFIIHKINIRRLEFHCSVQSGLCSSRSAEQRRLISQTAIKLTFQRNQKDKSVAVTVIVFTKFNKKP